jgi:hypothetical protein
MESQGEVVPSHMELPDLLQEILKMRPLTMAVQEEQGNDENIDGNAE